MVKDLKVFKTVVKKRQLPQPEIKNVIELNNIAIKLRIWLEIDIKVVGMVKGIGRNKIVGWWIKEYTKAK